LRKAQYFSQQYEVYLTNNWWWG